MLPIIVSVIVFIILFLVFCYYENNKIDVTDYKIMSSSAEKSFKIVQLSDFHSKVFYKAVDRVREMKPDIICITGDYINDRGSKKEHMLALGKKLLEIAPVYYITGNHERRLDSFESLMKELEDIGFTVLLNDTADTEFCRILGLDENQADFKDYKARKKGIFEYKDMSPYFGKLSECDGFRLVLSHFPENFEALKEMNYSQYDFDLQLSGHAHGGQWIFPVAGPLFAPGQGVLPKYARGSFGERPKLIVSRGLGNSEFPLRIFNHPEIVVIDVEKVEN